ncbi:hypothetical protein [Lentzea sp. NPDC059081]|uniref:hypothetical protein n=1 Tax=Lentzea sp. NPDC059081 TaxID=3346719 RepID=UPI0036784DE8
MRALMIGAAAVLAAALAPGTAHAAPPANDDFADATVVTALPFSSTVDTREGTAANDDPTSCDWSTSSVWYRYTAPADGFVRMATDRPDDRKPTISAYTGARGALTWTPGACKYPHGGGSDTFAVTAGSTYHFLVQDREFAGPVGFELRLVPRVANDDLAAAVDVPFGTDVAGDTGAATLEAGEVQPSCESSTTRSVWYRHTADHAGFLSARVAQDLSNATVSVFRGSALAEVDCLNTSHQPAVFASSAGETYYIRVANGIYGTAPLTLRVEDAPQIKPFARYVLPEQPGVFDEVRFGIEPGDPAGRWLRGGEIHFGDGTSAPLRASEGVSQVLHRYAADGEYEITISGYTTDGRSGTTTQKLKVETHDVTVSNLVAPATAKLRETTTVEASLTTNRYDENVVVELLRRKATGYWEVVGTETLPLAKDGMAVVPFTYTITREDELLGKATLKARVRLAGHEDNHPVDNERVVETIVVVGTR